MTDTVEVQTLHDGARNLIVRLSNRSDGTGEPTAVQKIDISTLSGPDGIRAPDFLAIKSIEYDVQGFNRVDILADATTDQLYAALGEGQGYIERQSDQLPNDTGAAGFTGDLMLLTKGTATNASYEIELHLIKYQN